MKDLPSDIAFTAAVKRQQHRLGSRPAYARWETSRGFQREISDELARFIEERSSFYLGTANADGQPYIQHRGGPQGFLKVVDSKTVAFADFGGNRQYISIGNLSENSRAFLFLMDYESAVRLKVWGTAEFVENDAQLLESLVDPAYRAVPERAILFHVEAWDKNCRQHIPKLVPAHYADRTRQLTERISELEREVEALRASGCTHPIA